MIPVYIINGFLESGKTEFLNYTLAQDYFQIEDTTLVIACEEGEVEYETEKFEYIENEADFTVENLKNLQAKHNARRILIEWNGVWNTKNMELPEDWEIDQQITLINGETFAMYYENMRSLMMEMLRNSELVIVNRCDDLENELATYKRNIRLVNQQCDIIFEGISGEILVSIEEELPYDLSAETIELDDNGYVTWYMDSMDFYERYEGKKLKFVAQIYKTDKMPKDGMILGRDVMTCCEDDLAFFGYPCMYEHSSDYVCDEWVRVTVTISREDCFAYEGSGTVFEILEIEQIPAPKNGIIE